MDAWKDHDESVPLVRYDHVDCMMQSAQFTKMSVAEFVSPRRIISVLRRARVPLVLVGHYGFDGWLQETRQCQIVEIIIRPRSGCTTLRLLTAAFSSLAWQGVGSRFDFLHKKSAKRLISIQLAEEPLELATFDQSLRVFLTPSLTYRIPSLEMALALRFASMTQLPWCAEKYYHAAQFVRMAKINLDVDWKRLRSVGDLIGPSQGRKLVRKVRDLHAGKRFQL